MSVTIDDYIRSVKEEIISARQNDIRGFLVKPSPAQLRNLCLLLFDEGLNNTTCIYSYKDMHFCKYVI